MKLEVGNIIKVKDVEYEVKEKISRPYALTRLRRLSDSELMVVPTPQLLKYLENMEGK